MPIIIGRTMTIIQAQAKAYHLMQSDILKSVSKLEPSGWLDI